MNSQRYQDADEEVASSSHQSLLTVLAGVVVAAIVALLARDMLNHDAARFDLVLLLLLGAAGIAIVIALLVQGRRLRSLVADLRRKNHELELSKDRADEASRTKTQFLSNMSHEIRTPLNGIIGTLQIVDPSSLTRDNRDSFEIIRRSSLSLLDIVNSILDISKIEADEASLSKRTFELRSFVSDVLTQHGVAASEKNIDFLIDFDPTIPRKVFTDPGKIEQILNNLLSNALKFTDRGAVTLGVSRHINVGAEPDDEYPDGLELWVSDTGIGISDMDQERLFQPFRQVDASLTRRHTGTGLGLSIVRKLAEMLDGSVSLQSSPGAGSTFRVLIPGIVPGDSGAGSGEDGGGAPEVVLFGGWYATIFRVCQVLTQLGARVRVVNTVPEAEALADALPPSVRAALVDRRFGGDALQLLSSLSRRREAGWQVPTILIQRGRADGAAVPDYVAGEIVDMFSRSSLLDVMKRSGILGSIGKLARQGLSPRQPPGATLRFAHLRVLIVDDNSINRRVLERLLRNAGILQVGLAGDAVEALDKIEDAGFDLVFMDIQMPDIDGYTAAKLIRQRGFRELKIVACSAHAFESDVLRSTAEGLDGHLSKPVVASELDELLVRLFLPAVDATAVS